MPKVKVGDSNVYYEVSGKGFPLVMIIGLSANKDWWDSRFVTGVSRKYKTIIFDNRGTGRTESPDKDFTIKTMADDTIGLMDALKIQKAHILGISLGGVVAQETVVNYPGRVEKLVLCATTCGFSRIPMNPEVAKALQGAGTQAPEQSAKTAVQLIFPGDFAKANPKIVEEMAQRILIAPTSRETYNRQLKASYVWDSYERLPKIKAPTLVLHGKKDILMPLGFAKMIADRIPGAKLVYLEKTGHGLFSVETDKVLKTLFEFLG